MSRSTPSSSASGSHPASTSADPRLAAVTALVRVEAHGAHAARLLGDAVPAERELVMGTLRWRLTLDELLGRHLRKPVAAADAAVRAVLRVGLYEACRMRTPVPVAVAEAVRVAKVVAPRAAGLVNAVLRRAAAEPWPDQDDPAVAAAVRLSHPAWLVERWIALLGEEAALAALAADQVPAPMCLLEAVSRREELESAGCTVAPHPVVPGVLVVTSGAEAAVSALRAGRAYAMDATAVAVARVLPRVDGPIVDLAAAPGGKSLVLAGERPGGRAVAADRSVGRAAMMRRTLRLAAASAAVAVADATAPAFRPGCFAAVLVDAPCSGTGTLRRHPEIKWRLQPEDLAPLAAAQRRIAQSAASLLRPGGYLLYATCSLEPEENAAVVGGLPLEPVDVAGRLPATLARIALPDGGAAIPPRFDGDGFTVHLLRKPA